MSAPESTAGADKIGVRVAAMGGSALANAINSLTSAGFQVAEIAGGTVPAPRDSLIWRQPFSVHAGAVLCLAAGRDLWEAVGNLALGGAGMESVSEEDCRSTWNEIAAQTFGAMAQAMSAELGREILVQGGGETQAPDADMASATLEVRDTLQVWYAHIYWNPAFELGLATATPQADSVLAPPRESPISKTLDLLLDVALPVSVSFGKTSLQIREVLKLNTGSVVELDRLVSEPVEVIVNNCVIARGEVVVVDGNYGVRVVHLASREDRLRHGMNEASSRLGAAGK